MSDITLNARLTFSEKDFKMAKNLLAYTMSEDSEEAPPDSFFIKGDPIFLNLTALIPGNESHQMCLAMMLFMVESAKGRLTKKL